MNISFGKGFVRIPSSGQIFNPDNVQTISSYKGETNILMQDCICIENIKAKPENIAMACIKAQNEGTLVDIEENSVNLYA